MKRPNKIYFAGDVTSKRCFAWKPITCPISRTTYWLRHVWVTKMYEAGTWDSIWVLFQVSP